MVECTVCRQSVPDGRFCARCGSAQHEAERARGRLGRAQYAADPDELVLQPGVVSTLFPHLGRGEMNEFRWALAFGLVVLGILAVLGLIGAALLLAALLVPSLYLLYLYEVRVIRDAPLQVLGFTLGGGVVLGILAEALTAPVTWIVATPLAVRASDLPAVLLVIVIIPVLQETVKAIPPLVLWRNARFPYTIDGLVLGVAAGLGFALGLSVYRFAPALPNLPAAADPPAWTWTLVSTAVLVPLLHGSTSGAVVASLWRFRHGSRGPLELLALPVAVIGHIGFAAVPLVLADAGFGPVAWLVWQVLVVAALLLLVRLVLQRALLDEAAAEGLRILRCPHCSATVTAAAFCPSCGLALVATPSRGHVETTREAAR